MVEIKVVKTMLHQKFVVHLRICCAFKFNIFILIEFDIVPFINNCLLINFLSFFSIKEKQKIIYIYFFLIQQTLSTFLFSI